MKGLYRHYSTILLFIGISVSFIAFLNGANIYKHIRYALAEINEYRYQYNYDIEITDIKNIDLIFDNIKKFKGNVLITGNTVYLDDGGFYQESDMLIKQDKDFVYPIKYFYPDGEVVIGKEFLGLTFNDKNERFIKINGENVKVAGVISSEKSDILNYKLIFVYKDMEMYKILLDGSNLFIEYGSNIVDISEDVENFYSNNCESANIYYEKSDDKFIEVGSESEDEKFYIVIALFSMINCIVISEFWILRRKQEIIIRKLWGFTNYKIFKMLYGQIMLISLCAVCAVLLFQCVIAIIDKSYGQITIGRFLISIIFVIISSIVVVLLPVYKAAHFNISGGLEMM